MFLIETVDHLTDVETVTTELFHEATLADGREPLSDQLRLDLAHGGRPGSRAALARDGDQHVVGYAQGSTGNDSTVVQLVVAPTRRADLVAIGDLLLRRVCDQVDTASVTWWVAEPDDAHHRLAADLGLAAHRTLYQMRRSLPTGQPVDIDVRPFRPGLDDDTWITVNNRAFHDHGEQGGWDLTLLRQRMAEPWFDPDGFLVHERDGRMAGFCWTKLHDEVDPVEGEIYVIAVDPDFHGAGLGRQLTLAGLEAIAQRGVRIGMLFVDAANTPAVRLYERLGFSVSRTDVAFSGPPPAPAPPPARPAPRP